MMKRKIYSAAPMRPTLYGMWNQLAYDNLFFSICAVSMTLIESQHLTIILDRQSTVVYEAGVVLIRSWGCGA